jgi:hypothetical protein
MSAVAWSSSDLRQARIKAARGRWPELDATQIKPLSGKKFRGKVGDQASGAVYDVVGGTVLEPGIYVEPAVADAYYVDESGAPVLLKLSDKPATLAEYEQQRAEQQRQRAEAEQAEWKRFASLSRKPLTLGDLTGEELPTLRAAAALLEQLGTIEAQNGVLVISLPEKFPGRGNAIRAARVLLHERELVLDALERRERDERLADLLPDEPALA